MQQKILSLLNELNSGLVEREATLKTALLTVLAGENLVLIGPPGTGKSLIARRIAECFAYKNNNSYFEYLLTKFSTPEEIFGPLSISELKADRFKRNTAGYLPSVNMAFLDEIFKASSSILNALLTILNERLYHNGAVAEKVPLQALIAASNELPTDQEELNALYDRFLVRSFVDYVSEDNLLLLFMHSDNPILQTHITAAELAHIKHAVQFVTISPEIAAAIHSIWIQHKETFKEDRREYLSDRRLKKVLHLLRVSAVTNGRSEVDLSDVLLLKDCLWNHQGNALKVRELILKTLQRYSSLVPQAAATTLLALEHDSPLYTVEDDGNGKNLITLNANSSTALTVKTSSAMTVQTARKPGQLHVKERGYKGLGTEDDPILIENVQDLMGLDGIGAKGYYFLQTADIDCKEITTWHTIHLQGHYNGGGHFIEYKDYALFQSIQAQSSVRNLELRNLRLAQNVTNSTITACQSSGTFIIDNVDKSTITACQSGWILVFGNVNNCTIKDCQSSCFLIHGTATNSTIKDCLVNFNWKNSKGEYGGIANTLKNSTVDQCFVNGIGNYSDDNYFNFYGIAVTCDASSINKCALGKFESKHSKSKIQARITGNIQNNSTFENNISIDSNPFINYDEKKNGKSISAALFNQRYFEHTLGWDFNNVWQWDDQKNHPVLRAVGVNAATALPAPSATAPAAMVDLLSQQIQANIWL